MTKTFVFAVPNIEIMGFVYDEKEIPKEVDTPFKEVEIHPAQIDWLNEMFEGFTQAQDFLQQILYEKDQDVIKTVSLE